MRIIIEAAGRRVIDLELLAPVPRSSPQPAAGAAAPSYDPRSTTSSHIEQGNEYIFRMPAGTVVIAGNDRKDPEP